MFDQMSVYPLRGRETWFHLPTIKLINGVDKSVCGISCPINKIIGKIQLEIYKYSKNRLNFFSVTHRYVTNWEAVRVVGVLNIR